MKSRLRQIIRHGALVLFSMLATGFALLAQPGKPAATQKPDTLRVKVISSFGPWVNGSKALVADIKRLLAGNAQVSVKDEKGISYRIVSYELTWKKKDISDDLRTGKQKTVYYFVGGTIEGPLLPASWKEEISGFLKSGEEISFGNILYFDPKRKVNLRGPSVVISIL